MTVHRRSSYVVSSTLIPVTKHWRRSDIHLVICSDIEVMLVHRQCSNIVCDDVASTLKRCCCMITLHRSWSDDASPMCMCVCVCVFVFPVKSKNVMKSNFSTLQHIAIYFYRQLAHEELVPKKVGPCTHDGRDIEQNDIALMNTLQQDATLKPHRIYVEAVLWR